MLQGLHWPIRSRAVVSADLQDYQSLIFLTTDVALPLQFTAGAAHGNSG